MGTSNKIIENIKSDVKEEILANKGNTAEVLVKYEDANGVEKHAVMEFHLTTTGSMFGKCSGVFDFDFFDAYNVTGWYLMSNVLKHL